MGIFSMLALNKEANLLDSKFYIIKTYLAVTTAYLWATHNPILKLDIISVLFGLMLTLEPVVLTGIRNGFNQIYSSLLGALATFLILEILGGVNVFTVALSIAFTIYICLKINWRQVCPVAIFTAIYMTQYVQKDEFGKASTFLTFRLRIIALMAGIVIAVIYNFIFSIVSYKSMIEKRIRFLLYDCNNKFKELGEALKNEDRNAVRKIKNSLPKSINNVDWVLSIYIDLKKENSIILRFLGVSNEYMEKALNIVIFIRNILHLNYDICYIIVSETIDWSYALKNKKFILKKIQLINNKFYKYNEKPILDKIKENKVNDFYKLSIHNEKYTLSMRTKKNNLQLGRIYNDLQMIFLNLNRI